jgi:Tfp pilus assembly protein FimT
MSSDLIVGIVIGILAAVAFLGVAVFYSGGEEERSRRRSGRNSNNVAGGRGTAAAAASSNRSTGTACESDLAWSDDEGDCGP